MLTPIQCRNIFTSLTVFTSTMMFLISSGVPQQILSFAIPSLCAGLALYFYTQHIKKNNDPAPTR